MSLLLGAGGGDAAVRSVRLPSADGEDAEGHDGAVVVEGDRPVPSAGSVGGLRSGAALEGDLTVFLYTALLDEFVQVLGHTRECLDAYGPHTEDMVRADEFRAADLDVCVVNA